MTSKPELVCVKVVPQRHGMDCVICCLAMLLGTSYEAALLAVGKVRPDMGTEGLYWKDAKAVAEILGYRLRAKNKYTPDDTVGIVSLVPTTPDEPNHHAALLLRGVLIDPREPSVWDDYEIYMQHYPFRLGSVLIQTK